MFVGYIIIHECPMNSDDSHGDFFGKLKIEDDTKLTNKQNRCTQFLYK